jgi:hypothetical protein
MGPGEVKQGCSLAKPVRMALPAIERTFLDRTRDEIIVLFTSFLLFLHPQLVGFGSGDDHRYSI